MFVGTDSPDLEKKDDYYYLLVSFIFSSVTFKIFPVRKYTVAVEGKVGQQNESVIDKLNRNKSQIVKMIAICFTNFDHHILISNILITFLVDLARLWSQNH